MPAIRLQCGFVRTWGMINAAHGRFSCGSGVAQGGFVPLQRTLPRPDQTFRMNLGGRWKRDSYLPLLAQRWCVGTNSDPAFRWARHKRHRDHLAAGGRHTAISAVPGMAGDQDSRPGGDGIQPGVVPESLPIGNCPGDWRYFTSPGRYSDCSRRRREGERQQLWIRVQWPGREQKPIEGVYRPDSGNAQGAQRRRGAPARAGRRNGSMGCGRVGSSNRGS